MHYILWLGLVSSFQARIFPPSPTFLYATDWLRKLGQFSIRILYLLVSVLEVPLNIFS